MTEKSFMYSFHHHNNNTSVREPVCDSFNQNPLSEFEKTQDEKSGYDIEVQNLTKILNSVEDGKDVFLNDMSEGNSSLNCTLQENQDIMSNVKGYRKYHCAECTYSTNNRTDFGNHTRIHTGERPFQCQQCHKTFHQKRYLTKHLRIHTGDRRFRCEQCHKTFTEKSILTNHLRIHTGEQPFKCEQCHKTFNQKSNLTTHLRIHTGQRPFQCQQCHKTFREKSKLTKHLRIHTGDRRFRCEQCHKTFTEKGNLTQHLRIHSGEHPFLCSTCGMGFNHRSNMNRHQRTHKENMALKDTLCAKDSQDPLMIEEHRCIPSSTIGPTEEGYFLCNSSGLSFHTLSSIPIHQTETDVHRNTLQAPLIQIATGNQDPFKIEVLDDISSSTIAPNEEGSFMCNNSGGRFDTWSSVQTHQIQKHPPTNTFQEPSLEEIMTLPFVLEYHMFNDYLT